MTRPSAFALGLGLGALVTPLCMYFAARYSGRHWLDITTKETR